VHCGCEATSSAGSDGGSLTADRDHLALLGVAVALFEAANDIDSDAAAAPT